MTGLDLSRHLLDQVKQAAAQGQALRIVGNNSKAHLGRNCTGEALNIGEHRGIVSYDPRELVITARAGTSLSEIQATLNDANQMLAFEPPHLGHASLGGTIACGLSGPRRPFAGAARDFVLGCSLLSGRGEIMHFGGQVMKNVAGYDVARLLTGSYGTLGALLDISLKVLPKPAVTTTLLRECSEADALANMSELRRLPLPIDGACFYRQQLYLRLSGSEQGVEAALGKLPGEQLNQRSHFWQRLNEQQLSFFDRPDPLWRISVKPATEPLDIEGEWLLDWSGAQRWLYSTASADEIRAKVGAVGGHATLFRNPNNQNEIFQPLPPAMLALQRRIKNSFDPAGIFNRGRMYAEI